MKKCATCKIEKYANLDFFYASKKAKTGISGECKECSKERTRKWSEENKDRKKKSDKDYALSRKEFISEYQARYRSENKKTAAEYHAAYRIKNSEILSIKAKEYFSKPETKRKRSIYSLNRKKHDFKYRITSAVRSSVSEAVKNKSGALRHVDWSIAELMGHLEKQFLKGMTWENYGLWHIDHITPCKSFYYSSPDDLEFKQCWSLSNLRPLWEKDNCSKQAKITHLI